MGSKKGEAFSLLAVGDVYHSCKAEGYWRRLGSPKNFSPVPFGGCEDHPQGFCRSERGFGSSLHDRKGFDSWLHAVEQGFKTLINV